MWGAPKRNGAKTPLDAVLLLGRLLPDCIRYTPGQRHMTKEIVQSATYIANTIESARRCDDTLFLENCTARFSRFFAAGAPELGPGLGKLYHAASEVRLDS